MLIAEIRKKLADLDEKDAPGANHAADLLGAAKEDLLTADLFGALKYLPRDPYLSTVLRMLADANGRAEAYHRHLPSLLDSAETMSFRFWPSCRTPPQLPGAVTEPDVMLSNDKYVFLVEAKLGSGFGRLQIERELFIALEDGKASAREAFLLLVTGAGSPPRFRIEDTRVDVHDYLAQSRLRRDIASDVAGILEANADRALWISWQGLFNALRTGHAQFCERAPNEAWVSRCNDMMLDLGELMLMRGVRPFGGFPRNPPRIPPRSRVFLAESITRRMCRNGFGGFGRTLTDAAVQPLDGWDRFGLRTAGRRSHPTCRYLALHDVVAAPIRPLAGWHLFPASRDNSKESGNAQAINN